MKARSCINKGRSFQRKIADQILERLQDLHPKMKLDERDVHSAIGAQSGSDIVLSSAGASVFPFHVECKKTKKFNLYAAYAQAGEGLFRRGIKDPSTLMRLMPIAIGSEDRKPPVVVISHETAWNLNMIEGIEWIDYGKADLEAWQLVEDMKYMKGPIGHVENEGFGNCGLRLISFDLFLERFK